MQVKICGLSRPADIDAVNAAQPDYCGFVINVPKSHRNVSPDQLRALRRGLSASITPVGVFVNEPPETIAALLNEGTISIAQLHGSENASDIAQLRKRTTKPIWQAFQVKAPEDVQRANESTADFILLDAGAGCGAAFDWSLLAFVNRPFALAGGLHLGNLPTALQSNAAVLDLSSGAETDGKKDFDKIKRIVKMIKENNSHV